MAARYQLRCEGVAGSKHTREMAEPTISCTVSPAKEEDQEEGLGWMVRIWSDLKARVRKGTCLLYGDIRDGDSQQGLLRSGHVLLAWASNWSLSKVRMPSDLGAEESGLTEASGL